MLKRNTGPPDIRSDQDLYPYHPQTCPAQAEPGRWTAREFNYDNFYLDPALPTITRP
jgi:hypothetical protein